VAAQVTGTSQADRPEVTTWLDQAKRKLFESQGLWTQETWFHKLELAARRAPSALSVADESRAMTRGEVMRDATRLAAYLWYRGVRRGDVITIVIPNWCEFVVVHAAIGVLGAVANPVVPKVSRKELLHMLSVAKSRFVVAASTSRAPTPVEVAHEAVVDVPSVLGVIDVRGTGPESLGWVLSEAWEDRIDMAHTAQSARDWDTITFTSGTESLPKGVVHSHQSTMFGLRAYIGGVLGLSSADAVFAPSPICHASGLEWGLRAAIYTEAPLVLQDRWDPKMALDLLARYRCSYTLAATPFILDLIHEQRSRGRDLHLKYVASGGAPIPRHLVMDVRDVLRAELMSVYGSSETYIATATRPNDPDELLMSDGLPLPGTEIAVVDEHRRALPAGEQGEIVTRGPHVFLGYLGEPDLTHRSFHDDWYRFGDLGYLDNRGCLHVTGRLKDIIIRGGENISVREVEEILLTHHDVIEAAVVGYPDTRLGERCCAVLVVKPESRLDLSSVNEHLLGAGLPKYKLPERLRFISKMPMTETGKIRKSELRDLVAREIASCHPMR
jgi:acyl-coenzyme A synthetase/AMP-(fatty) acid ligase